jgi:hypothetical protein
MATSPPSEEQRSDAFATQRITVLAELFEMFKVEWEPALEAAQRAFTNVKPRDDDDIVTESFPESKLSMHILTPPRNVHLYCRSGYTFCHAHFDPPPITMFIGTFEYIFGHVHFQPPPLRMFIRTDLHIT